MQRVFVGQRRRQRPRAAAPALPPARRPPAQVHVSGTKMEALIVQLLKSNAFIHRILRQTTL